MPLICHFYGENFEIPHLKESQNLKHWCQQEPSCDYFGGDIQKFSSKLPGFFWVEVS